MADTKGKSPVGAGITDAQRKLPQFNKEMSSYDHGDETVSSPNVKPSKMVATGGKAKGKMRNFSKLAIKTAIKRY